MARKTRAVKEAEKVLQKRSDYNPESWPEEWARRQKEKIQKCEAKDADLPDGNGSIGKKDILDKGEGSGDGTDILPRGLKNNMDILPACLRRNRRKKHRSAREVLSPHL